VLGDLLARPDLRAALAAAGVRRARARYGWATVAARTEAVYREAILGRLGRLAVVGG